MRKKSSLIYLESSVGGTGLTMKGHQSVALGVLKSSGAYDINFNLTFI